MGLLARAIEINREVSTVLGLLERARRIYQSAIVDAQNIPQDSIPEEHILLSNIISTVSTLNNTIDAPYLLLTTLSTIISNFEATYLSSNIEKTTLTPSFVWPSNSVLPSLLNEGSSGDIEKYSRIQIIQKNDSDWSKIFPSDASFKKVLIIPSQQGKTYLVIHSEVLLDLSEEYMYAIALTLSNAMQKIAYTFQAGTNYLPFADFLGRIKTKAPAEVYSLSKSSLFNALSPLGFRTGFEMDCLNILSRIVTTQGWVSVNSDSFFVYIPDLHYINGSMVCAQLLESFQLAFSTDISSIEFKTINAEQLIQSM